MIKWTGHLRIISGRLDSFPNISSDISEAIQDIQRAGYNLTCTESSLYIQDPKRLDISYSIESPNPREQAKSSILSSLLCLIRERGGVAIIQEDKERHQTISYLGTDQDGTLLSQEILPMLAQESQSQLVCELTQRAMDGKEDFATNFALRSQLLIGYSTEKALHILEQIPLAPMAEYALGLLGQNAITRDLITSNYSFFAQNLCLKYGLDGYCASTMEIYPNGLWSGRLIPPIVDSEAKKGYLSTRLKQLGLSPYQSLCIGDGANDIPMLSLSGTSILYSSNPSLSPLPWTFMLPYFGIDT